jgi:hypothetical protein
MKRVRCLSELIELKQKIRKDFGDYLAEEFYSLYEYLSNGERIEEFLLDNHQAIVIVEESKELDLLLQNRLEVEYVEEVQLHSSLCIRIGISQLEDKQLYYYLQV